MQEFSRNAAMMCLAQPAALHKAQFAVAGDPAEKSAGPDAEGNPAQAGTYAACSAEIFRAAGSLNAAHRDAGGFLDQIDQYATPDFWRRDASVKSWIYARGDDGGQDDGDMDAVRVFYHAGHGAMDDGGSFHLPMGALSAGADASLSSGRMRFGADRLRYLYWSASQSLRISDGHSPLRSWGSANCGLRMMFGFDSASWDSGRYGAQFWRNWRMGKSFSQAWLDGAADVSQDQVPVICAMGATPDEAQARLYTESRFQSQRGARDWWMWRWAQPVMAHRRPPLTEMAGKLSCARLVPVEQDHQVSDAVLDMLGIDPRTVLTRSGGLVDIALPGVRFLRSSQGAVLLEFGRSMRGERSKVPLQRRALLGRAWSALRRHGFLRAGHELCFDAISLALSAGRSLQNRAEALPEAVDEIVIQFRQMIDGVPIITPDSGRVRVVLCANGALLRIEADLRRVAMVLAQPGTASDASGQGRGVQDVLARHAARLMRDLAARGAAPLSLGILPGTTEIGYGIRSNTARLIARRAVEIRCVRGYHKRYWIQSDLGD